ncbi:MAG: HAD family phosphatase [Deltaproteobacteria bacterium]|nr:HAD family phosphatase [Deltaproteobacteria bacterium]
MGRIKAAIFDMDGLMVETESLYFQAESEVARRYGKTFTREVMEKMMGYKATRSIQIMMEALLIQGDVHEIETLRDDLYRELLLKGVKPMDGLFDLLCWLESHGFRKAVATSSKPIFKEIIFDRLHLHDRFELVVTGEDVSRGKPSPEIYRLALHRLGLGPRQCVVLEDSAVGLKSAKGAGCSCIVVPNDYTRNQDFSGADLVAPHLFHEGIRRFFQTT